MEDGAYPNDPETRWFAGGDCASCQHRSYPCSLRQGRRNVLGGGTTPPRVRVDSDTEMGDMPSGQSSQTTVVGRPILESGSRSQHFRAPRLDFNNPAVAAQYVQDLQRHIADVEAGNFPAGSPSTASTASDQLSWAGLSPPGPQTPSPRGGRGGWGPRGNAGRGRR